MPLRARAPAVAPSARGRGRALLLARRSRGPRPERSGRRGAEPGAEARDPRLRPRPSTPRPTTRARPLLARRRSPAPAKLATLLQATYGTYSIGHLPRLLVGRPERAQGGPRPRLDGHVAQQRAEGQGRPRSSPGCSPPTQYGNEAAMARRLGVMYIGWNNQMWRGYDIARGWTDLKGCSRPRKAGTAYDNDCHRNHVHLSLTWEGAMALTSFWSGTPLPETCRWAGATPPGAARRRRRPRARRRRCACSTPARHRPRRALPDRCAALVG